MLQESRRRNTRLTDVTGVQTVLFRSGGSCGCLQWANLFPQRQWWPVQTIIKNMKQFNLAVCLFARGVSFWAWSGVLENVTQDSGSHIVGSTSPGDIGHIVRQVVGVNLSAISVVLDNTWAFCVSFDRATHNNKGYFDVRFACTVCGKSYNFHLLALPIQNIAPTGANYCDIVVKVLELLYSGGNQNFTLLLVMALLQWWVYILGSIHDWKTCVKKWIQEIQYWLYGACCINLT